MTLACFFFSFTSLQKMQGWVQHVKESVTFLLVVFSEFSGLFHKVHQSGEHGDVTWLKTHLLDLRQTTVQSMSIRILKKYFRLQKLVTVCLCVFVHVSPPTCSPRYSTSSASWSRILPSSVRPPFAPVVVVVVAPFLACFSRFRLSSIFLTELSTSEMVS